ncbi:MAG: hypothetical protein KJ000_26330 [Pirellulaceae bacterium]|nr:hypothetical protein [Pirellulaceae bacterium]
MNDVHLIVPFPYAKSVHDRRHGPRGYAEPARYKPWLRDEYQFRCVYCLCRERWCPDGEDSFSVEHFRPQSVSPNESCDYDNLMYTCCRCNAAKRDLTGLLNPAEIPLADHVEILEDGTIRGLTEDGWHLIRVCQLDRPNLTEFRRGIFDILRGLELLGEIARGNLLRRYFGFPSNLPHLAALRPPGGNSRPDGIRNSFYERRSRGDLLDVY